MAALIPALVAWRTGLVLLLVSAWAGGVAAQTLTFPREKVLTSIGDPVKVDVQLAARTDSAGLIARKIVAEQGVSSLRLHFVVGTAGSPWVLLVRSLNGNVLWQATSDNAAEGELWSDEIAVSEAVVELISFAPKNPVQLTIDYAIVARPGIPPLSHVGEPQFESIEFQEPWIKQAGKSAVRLRFVSDSNRRAYVCTGFLVSSRLVITNRHCISSDSEMRSTLIDFDFDKGGGMPSSTLRAVRRVASGNASALDYTVLELEQSVLRTPLVFSDTRDASKGQKLVVIQHPGGRAKEVSLVDCNVRDTSVTGMDKRLTDFGHGCDTEGGSSGAPVLDRQTRKVVGLHHLGFEESSRQKFNRATYSGEILADFTAEVKRSIAQ
jgi:V8-like Glu-specific endopeptidase